MNPVAVPVLVLAGITLYVGVYHLGLYLRRREQADLWFCLTCFAIAIYDVASAFLYDSRDVAQGMHWQRVQIAAALPIAFSLVHFLAAYSGVKLNQGLVRALWIWPAMALFGLWDPWGLVITDIPNVQTVSTPLGQVTYYEAVLGPLFHFYELAIAGVAVVTVYIAQRAKRFGRKKLALPLAVGVLLGGFIHDTLVAQGVLHNVYIAEYCWFAVMFLMNATLSHEVVDAALTKRNLQEAEERIAITLDSIQDAVITTDNEGNVMHLNPAAERLLGTPLEIARKKPLKDIASVQAADMDRPARDPIQYALSHPPDPYGNLPVLSARTGQRYRIDQAGAPLRHPDGRLMGAVVVYRDLTVQHNALEELQHSQRMQSMGQLAGGVAHDLNNLLTPIISYSELCQRALASDSPPYAYLGHVLTAASRAAELTRQLLALSRKQILDTRVLPLNSCILEWEPFLKRLVPEDVTVQLELATDAGNVRVDSSQMQHVLMNLVANARDAMPRGGEITIMTMRDDARTTSVLVKDSGSGMDADVQKRLFEPFFTTKPRGKGTGLGLATVRGIVEQHGGRIEVESELGIGTTFRIQLPVSVTEVPDVLSHRSPAPTAARGTEVILVVEDDPTVRSLTEDALTELGYRVLTASGARAALVLIESEKVELLLTDVVMPGMSGPELYRTLRERAPKLRCLYMSGHADDLLGDRGFLARGTQLLRKPFTITSLATQVRDILDRELDEGSRSGVR
jgi:PAS domain S-box-containing protein